MSSTIKSFPLLTVSGRCKLAVGNWPCNCPPFRCWRAQGALHLRFRVQPPRDPQTRAQFALPVRRSQHSAIRCRRRSLGQGGRGRCFGKIWTFGHLLRKCRHRRWHHLHANNIRGFYEGDEDECVECLPGSQTRRSSNVEDFSNKALSGRFHYIHGIRGWNQVECGLDILLGKQSGSHLLDANHLLPTCGDWREMQRHLPRNH